LHILGFLKVIISPTVTGMTSKYEESKTEASYALLRHVVGSPFSSFLGQPVSLSSIQYLSVS
jgi:hypothetical protein